MKLSSSKILIFFVTLALVLPAKIQALSIQLLDDGSVIVQPGLVLGESTEQKSEDSKPDAGRGSGGGASEVKPAEIRSSEVKSTQVSKEALKKQEEQKKMMTQTARKNLEQANRVKRMIENKKSSVEVEFRKENTDSVNVKMREFEKPKNASEDAKQTDERNQENQKNSNEQRNEVAKKVLENAKEQNGENRNKNEDVRRVKSIVEERAENLELQVGPTDIRSTEKGFEIEQGNVKAHTELPVSVQTDTKQLSVVTSEGTKTVTTLPDEAKNTVVSSGLANDVVGEITLQQQGNDVVFHMNTSNNKRMFGLLPIKVNREVDVSATTGQITSTTQSLGQRLLDFFSF